jgi:hypothetical protein
MIWVIESLEPLGEEYVLIAREGLMRQGWIKIEQGGFYLYYIYKYYIIYLFIFLIYLFIYLFIYFFNLFIYILKR